MGTRGTIAFKVDGQVKGSYNHWDSYPSGLGNKMLHFLRQEHGTGAEAKAKAQTLVAVPEDRSPTAEEVARLKPYTDLGVSRGTTEDWYCLLRGTQYNPGLILEAGMYYPSRVGDDEYAYVVDYDDEKLEVWEGANMSAAYAFDNLPVTFTDEALPAPTFAGAWTV